MFTGVRIGILWILVSRSVAVRVDSHEDLDELMMTSASQLGANSLAHDCAIVGGSESLKGHGPDIDKHHTIVRVNRIPVAGFEDSVGTRTNILISNAGMTKMIPKKDSFTVPLFHVGNGGMEADDSCTITREGGNCSFESVLFGGSSRILLQAKRPLEIPDFLLKQVAVFPTEILDLAHAWLPEICKPSTGFLTILFMASKCDSLHLYGFTNAGPKENRFVDDPHKEVAAFDGHTELKANPKLPPHCFEHEHGVYQSISEATDRPDIFDASELSRATANRMLQMSRSGRLLFV